MFEVPVSHVRNRVEFIMYETARGFTAPPLTSWYRRLFSNQHKSSE